MHALRQRSTAGLATLVLALILVLPATPVVPPGRTVDQVGGAPVAGTTQWVNLSNVASNWTSDFAGVAWPTGPFSEIVVQLTLTNYGDPWDRADWIDLNNVTLLDVTTLENGSDNNHVQSLEVNITEYESLFASPGYVWWQAMPNWISPCDAGTLGCWTGILSFGFTFGSAPPGLPTIVPVLPFATLTTTSPWVNGTLRVPGSYSRAEAVIFQEGQGNDEFWYAQPFASRELEWQWNNQTVLAMFPLPFINSGGALGGEDDLYEWNGTPAIGTEARPAVTADLTPWLDLLSASPWYNFTVVDNDNSWQIGLSLFLWSASDQRNLTGAGSGVLQQLDSKTGSIQGNAYANFSEPFATESYNLSWSQYLNVSSSSYSVATGATSVDRVVSDTITLEQTDSLRTDFRVRVDSSGAVHMALFANWTNLTNVTGNGQNARLTQQTTAMWTIDGSDGGLDSTEAKAATGSDDGTYSAPAGQFSSNWGWFQNRSGHDGVGTSELPSTIRSGLPPTPLPGRFVVAPTAVSTHQGAIAVDLMAAPGSDGPAIVTFGNETLTVPVNDTVVVNAPSLRNGTYDLEVASSTTAGPSILTISLSVTGWTPPYVAPLSATATVTAEFGDAPWKATFNGSAQGGSPAYSWAWTFGDGATASTQNATHVYTTAGNYVAELTVTDAAGRTSRSPVDVFTFPTLSVVLSSSRSTWTAGSPVTVSANVTGGDGPYNYSWAALAGGCPATSGVRLACTPTASGVASIRVSVTDSLGYSAAAWYNTSVNAVPPGTSGNGVSPLVVGASVLAVVLGVVAFLALRRRRSH
jgi:PKD repeat protein